VAAFRAAAHTTEMIIDPFRRFLSVTICFRHADQLMVAAVPLVGGAVFGLGAREIGWMVAAQGSAWLLLSLPFGVMVDRVAPLSALRRGLSVMAAGFGVSAAGLALGHAPLFTFGAFIAAAAVVIGFLAEGAVLQRLVPGPGLPRANARMQIIQSFAMLLGPLVMGWLIARGHGLPGLGIGFALVATALVLCRGFPAQEPPVPRERRPMDEIGEGLRFVTGQPLLRGIVACSLFWNMAAFAMAAFFVPYAIRSLAMTPDQIGFAQGLQGVGSLAAALVVGWILARSAPRAILFFGPASSTAAAGLLLVAPTIGGLPAAMALFLLLGFGPILWFVCQNTIRQLVTPHGMLGRVGAVIQLAIYGVRSIGALIGGQVAESYGYTAAIWLVIALFALSTLTVPLSALGRLARLPDAELQVEVPPVVGVDLEALQHQEEETRPDRDRIPLERCPQEDEPPAHRHRDADKAEIGDAAKPAVGREGVEEGVVRILGKELAEHDRAEAVGQIQQQGDRPELVAEAPGLADVVVLSERGAHLEDGTDRLELQRDDEQHGEEHDAQNADQDDSHTNAVGSRGQEAERHAQSRRADRDAPGTAGKAEE
jgi:predicted MFS family arabinose efflux permease